MEDYFLCRLCLTSCSYYIDIFNPKGTNGMLVWKILKEMLQLDVSNSDGLPVTICEDCIAKIREFKYFKAMCINSRIEFLKLMANKGLVGDEFGTGLPFPVSKLSIPSKKPSVQLIQNPDDRDVIEVIEEVKPSVEELDASVLPTTKKSSSFAIGSLGDNIPPPLPLAEEGETMEIDRMDNAQQNANESIGKGEAEEAPKEEGEVAGANPTLYVCHHKECEKVFDSLKGLRIHAQRCVSSSKDQGDDGSTWGCPFCPTKADGRQSLAEHMRTQHKVAPLPMVDPKTNKTGVGQGEENLLRRGMMIASTHSAQTDVKLLHCSVELVDVARVKLKEVSSANVTASPLGQTKQENVEGTGSSDSSGRTDGGTHNYRCGSCPMSFKDGESLRAHLEKGHSDRRLHSCRKCLKFFSKFSSYLRHSRTHKEKKDLFFWCNLCHETFGSSSALVKHTKNAHSVEISGVCKVCRCGFQSKKAESRHCCVLFAYMFPCFSCGRAYRSRRSCNSHVKKCIVRQKPKRESK